MRKRRVEGKSSYTAEVNAAQRAAEMRLPEGRRLFCDPYAHHFVVNPRSRLLVAGAPVGLRVFDRVFPGLQALILLRTRFASDVILRAQAEGIDQIVLLGAGYDSTAFRLPEPSIDIYEVDVPPTQEAKRSVVELHRLTSPHRLHFVPCDLESGSFVPDLLDAEFDSHRPSVFIWLGVSCYLSRDAFLTALEDIAVVSAPDSRLVLDYMDPGLIDRTIDNPGALRMARAVARRGEPYRLGWQPDQLERTLRRAGFQVAEHCRIPELAEKYGPQEGVWCRTDDWMGVVEAQRRPNGFSRARN